MQAAHTRSVMLSWKDRAPRHHLRALIHHATGFNTTHHLPISDEDNAIPQLGKLGSAGKLYPAATPSKVTRCQSLTTHYRGGGRELTLRTQTILCPRGRASLGNRTS